MMVAPQLVGQPQDRGPTSLSALTEVDASAFVQSCKIKCLFNNVNGFSNKNHLIKNSRILACHDLAVFQETNITDDKVDAGYLDFAACGWTALSLTTVKQDHFCRGMMIAWNPNVCDVSRFEVGCTTGFEISVVNRIQTQIASLPISPVQ